MRRVPYMLKKDGENWHIGEAVVEPTSFEDGTIGFHGVVEYDVASVKRLFGPGFDFPEGFLAHIGFTSDATEDTLNMVWSNEEYLVKTFKSYLEQMAEKNQEQQ